MIPEKIHYIWIGGKPMPNDVKQHIEKCRKINPGYEIKIWNEDNFDCTANAYCKEAYDAKKWAFVTDYMRLAILYENGGIYMDTDVETVKSFDDLLCHKAFSGFEGYDRITTGTMGAEPGNPWIKANLDYYTDRHFVREDGSYDLTTNVETITKITKKLCNIELNNTYQDFGDVVFMPFDWLCAKNISTGKVKKTKNTYTVHHFAGSWLSPRKKLISWLVNHRFGWFVKFVVALKRAVKPKGKNENG